MLKGFSYDGHITYINNNYIEQLFQQLDFNKSGWINYSEFLAATVDKKTALTNANLLFAFNYFDIDNKGYITKHDLKEVFRRQGKSLQDDQLTEIIRQAKDNLTHDYSSQKPEDLDNENETINSSSNQQSSSSSQEERQSAQQIPDKTIPSLEVGDMSDIKLSKVNMDESISYEEFQKVMK